MAEETPGTLLHAIENIPHGRDQTSGQILTTSDRVG
jgi:hypothetical protein